MHNWLSQILLAFIFLSFQAHAMEDHELCPFLPLEMLVAHVQLDIEDLHNLSEVNKSWSLVFAHDIFWQSLYYQIKGSIIKAHEDLDYKQNYMLLHTAKIICHSSENCRAKIQSSLTNPDRIKFQEIISSCGNKTLFLCKLSRAQVFCTCFGPYYCGEPNLDYHLREALDLALSEDVLVVLPVGNNSNSYSCKVLGQDIHEIYPNVIWTTGCDAQGNIWPSATCGELIDIALCPSDDNIGETITRQGTALSLGEFIANLRALRPILRAPEIRSLILESADRTEESNIKIPNGGILNREAAIKAVREFVAIREGSSK